MDQSLTGAAAPADPPAYLTALTSALKAVDIDALNAMAAALIDTWRRGHTIFLAGNGGSAATASHFALDLAKTTLPDGAEPRRVRALALTDNVGLLTAWANDTSYEAIFAEQVRSLADPGDALVLISCSGTSPNILAAARAGRDVGARLMALTTPRTPLGDLADFSLEVDAPNIQIVEDVHGAVCHALTRAVRAELARAA